MSHEESKDTLGCDVRVHAISHFIEMPMNIRLQYIEVLIYMSDYQQANHISDHLVMDLKKDIKE